MSSLPWICAVTLTLLCCLTAQPVTMKPTTKHPSYVSEFSEAIENYPCSKDTENTLYSPVNVKETCLYSALDCYVKELKNLVLECDAEEAADDLLTTLEGLKNQGSFCSNYICEVSPQKPLKEFLENMETLEQRINSLPLNSRH